MLQWCRHFTLVPDFFLLSYLNKFEPSDVIILNPQLPTKCHPDALQLFVLEDSDGSAAGLALTFGSLFVRGESWREDEHERGLERRRM